MMNQKNIILLIGFLALSDAWVLDLERAQRTIEEIDHEEATTNAAFQGKGN